MSKIMGNDELVKGSRVRITREGRDHDMVVWMLEKDPTKSCHAGWTAHAWYGPGRYAIVWDDLDVLLERVVVQVNPPGWGE
jgi:hypothetical protein